MERAQGLGPKAWSRFKRPAPYEIKTKPHAKAERIKDKLCKFEGREQISQMLNLFKNVTIAGGFILLAEYAAGRYGFDAKRGHTIDAPSSRMGMA